jgi:excisionase family DNA binding protein
MARDITQPEFYSAADVARLTGVSHMTIRRAIWRGDLPASKIGRKVLIKRESFNAWLASCNASRVEAAS